MCRAVAGQAHLPVTTIQELQILKRELKISSKGSNFACGLRTFARAIQVCLMPHKLSIFLSICVFFRLSEVWVTYVSTLQSCSSLSFSSSFITLHVSVNALSSKSEFVILRMLILWFFYLRVGVRLIDIGLRWSGTVFCWRSTECSFLF